MRIFHFINEEFGLENLRRRRLKIATLGELNDPFEFLSASLADENLRRAFNAMKNELAEENGLLCFSRKWHNPVQWSHYAAKHTGLCLGFDVPDEQLEPVIYSRKRLAVEAENFHNLHEINIDTFKPFLFTKYSHWRYENEVRSFVSLDEKDPEKKMYFIPFSDKLRLSVVIVGAQSNITRDHLQRALGDLAPSVKSFNARLAFKTFKVVRQRNEKLWV